MASQSKRSHLILFGNRTESKRERPFFYLMSFASGNKQYNVQAAASSKQSEKKRNKINRPKLDRRIVRNAGKQ